MNMIEISATEAKRHLAKYLSRANHQKCRVVVSRRGRAMAAIVSMDDLRTLEQMEERKGLSSVVGKWKGFAEIADNINSAR